MKRLINKDTQEQVAIVGPPTDDGRILVQRPNGTLDVLDVHQLDTDTASDDV